MIRSSIKPKDQVIVKILANLLVKIYVKTYILNTDRNL